MATAISWSNPPRVRRCDATCHTAKKPGCTCICGGRLHGAGSSERAIERNTEDWLGKDWQEKDPAVLAEALQSAFRGAVTSLGFEPAGRGRVAILGERKARRLDAAGGAR